MGKNKNKNKKQKADRRRQQKRGQRNARKSHSRGSSSALLDGGDCDDLFPPARLLALDPPAPERCSPPIFLDGSGRVVDDPYATLGVEPRASEEEIRAAWRRGLREHPPERDPEGARRLQEARARLLDPSKVIERELGIVLLPSPEAYDLPEVDEDEAVDELAPLNRAVGQLALYALLEDLFDVPATAFAEQLGLPTK